MPTIEYVMRPQGKVLEQFADCRARNSFIMGPLGSGKTVQVILKLLELMCEQPPVTRESHPNYGYRLSRIIAARNTYSELFSTTIKDWLEIHGDLGQFREGNKQPPTHSIEFNLTDGTTVKSEVIFIAFDRPDHVKKARGIQTTWVWLNETKELSKSVVDMLDLRCGRYPSMKEGIKPKHYGLIGDTNAPHEDSWYYKLAEEIRPEGWAFHRQAGGVYREADGWYLNEEAENLSNLPEDYYKRGLEGKSDDWIKVNLANEYGFVSSGKPVHPMYTDSVHCAGVDYVPSKDVPIVLGFDFGRTPACAFLQRDSMGRWHCFDEYCLTDSGAVDFAPSLKRYIDGQYPEFKFRGWGDPSGDNKNQANSETPFKIIRAAGLPASPTMSNDPALRRAALELPLKEILMDGKPRFLVSPKAKMIRKGLQGGFCYRRIQVSGEKYTDEPDKNEYSHPVEALEYALQGEGEGRQALRSQQRSSAPRIAEMSINVF